MTNDPIHELQTYCKQYAKPNTFQAYVSFVNTILVEALAIRCIYSQFSILGWILHTVNILRVFVQFHDMAHYSFFQTIEQNQFFGELLGFYMMYPFQAWRDGHNHHHHHFGILGGEDVSQTILFTKQDYERFPLLHRIGIRIIREPIVFFPFTIPFLWTFGTLIQYIMQYPWYHKIVLTKIVSMAFYCMFAPKEMWISYYIAISIGGVLFHLQHSVNTPYRKREGKWKREEASLVGSTYLQIPPVLSFFTNGIEYHHIHHLNPMVPSYAIGKCHHSYEGDWSELGVCFVDGELAFKSLENVMYDEENELCVPFSYNII